MECKLVGPSFQSAYYPCCPGSAADVTSRVVHVYFNVAQCISIGTKSGVSKIAFEIALVP